MRYLDTNVFCYPALYEGPKADHARTVLRSLGSGDEGAVTASLTLDEVAWVLQREAGREAALEECRRILDMPNLRIVDVTARTVDRALGLMEDHEELDPRDAIHAAAAIRAGVHTIVSADPDFDAVPGLDREPLGSSQ